MSEGAFAIIVKFTLKPGMADAFRPLILENAAASVRDEPTCRQFQVLNDEQSSEVIFLYEVYEDAAALEVLRAVHLLPERADPHAVLPDEELLEVLDRPRDGLHAQRGSQADDLSPVRVAGGWRSPARGRRGRSRPSRRRRPRAPP